MAITLNQHRKSITSSVIDLFSDDKTPNQAFSAWFKDKVTTDKMVSIEVERNRQLVAVDVQRCTDPNRNIFSKSTEKLFVPPFYNESFDFTACQRYDEVFANINGGSVPTILDLTRLVSDSAAYALKLKNKIARAKELQRSQVLQTGIVTLVNGDNIDFKRKAASLVTKTSTAAWDQAATATPFVDLQAGATFLRQEGLSVGNNIDAIFGQNAFTNFINNTSVQNTAKFFNQIQRIDIGMPAYDAVSGLTFMGRVGAGDFMIDMWTYADFYEAADGTKTPYVDTDTVIMLPRDFRGWTAHAGVPAIMGDSAVGQYIAPMAGDYWVRDVIDQVKMAWDFFVTSAPLAIPVSIDRIYTIKTR